MSKPDIVDRLRSVDSQGIRGIAERVSELLLCRGAADEIERLREENKQLRGLIERCQPWDICRDNLKEEVEDKR